MLKLFFVQAFLLRLFWHHHWNPTALQIGTFFDRAVTIKMKYTYILPVVDQLQRKLEQLQHLTLLRKNLHFQLLLSVGKQAYYSAGHIKAKVRISQNMMISHSQQQGSEKWCERAKLFISDDDMWEMWKKGNLSGGSLACRCLYTTYLLVLKYSPTPELLGRLEIIYQQQKYSFEKPILKSAKRLLL